MRKWIILLLLLAAIGQADASSLPSELTDPLPPGSALEELEEGETGVHTLTDGLADLWDQACGHLLGMVKESVSCAVLLLSVVVICGLAQDCLHAARGDEAPGYVPMVGALAITWIAAGNMQSLMGQGVETMEQLNVYSKALLPTLAAAVAAGGGVASAGVRHVAGVFFADVLITIIRNVLLPMVYVYVALAAADAMLPGHRLKTIAKAISKCTAWVLTGTLVLYTGYLTISGAVAGSTDTLTTQLTRSAMGTVPVVGNIISDAAGTVLAGAAMLKNTIGVAGMLGILAMCLVPFLRLAVQYLLYKITAFLAGTMGASQLVDLVDGLGSAFGMVLGMTGACALLLLISVISSIMVVTV